MLQRLRVSPLGARRRDGSRRTRDRVRRRVGEENAPPTLSIQRSSRRRENEEDGNGRPTFRRGRSLHTYLRSERGEGGRNKRERRHAGEEGGGRWKEGGRSGRKWRERDQREERQREVEERGESGPGRGGEANRGRLNNIIGGVLTVPGRPRANSSPPPPPSPSTRPTSGPRDSPLPRA